MNSFFFSFQGADLGELCVEFYGEVVCLGLFLLFPHSNSLVLFLLFSLTPIDHLGILK